MSIMETGKPNIIMNYIKLFNEYEIPDGWGMSIERMNVTPAENLSSLNHMALDEWDSLPLKPRGN